MMVLPFLGFAVGAGAALMGRRRMALAAWGVALAVMLALFRAHVTDALPLDF